MGVSHCIGELKVMCFCSLMLLMAPMTMVAGTLNSMMPRSTDVGYERRFWVLIVSSKDIEGDWYYLWFCFVLSLNFNIFKEGL